MELLSRTFPDRSSLVVAPLGDMQWSGESGPTAQDHLKRHIDRCLNLGAFFIGMGDYIDFMSPSNRQRLSAAGLYDTAKQVIDEAALELNQQVYDKFLKDTYGRWIGLLEGHHFSQLADGTTTDMILADKLGTAFLGTSALVRLRYYTAGSKVNSLTLWAHHGNSGGGSPGAPLNYLDRIAHGWVADAFLVGHNTKTPATRISRPEAKWAATDDGAHELVHKDIVLVNTGGFSKSSIVGSKQGRIPRGDYAEARVLNPSPLSAPILFLNEDGTIRVEV